MSAQSEATTIRRVYYYRVLRSGGILASIVLALTLLMASVSTAAAAPSYDTTPTASTHQLGVAGQLATAPRFVTGYSFHCSQEMANDNVTGSEVDFVVQNYYLSAAYNDLEDTWRYPGPTLIVVLNPSGFCVTVFRP